MMMLLRRKRLFAFAAALGFSSAVWSLAGADSGVVFDDAHLTVTDTQALAEPDCGDVDKPLLENLRRPSQKLLEVSPDELMAANENAGRKLNSRMPVEPWLDAIAVPPFLVVYPSVQKDVEIKEWRFSIMDDAGNTRWTRQVRGSIPDRLAWDGQTNQGGMIDVEMPIFYTLGAMDMGGNPIFMSGPSQALSALAFFDQGRLVMRISSTRLFRSGKDIILSDNGEALLRESLDQISKGRYTSFQITAFAGTDKLADMQADQVARYFMRQFTLPRTAFTLNRHIVNDRFKIEIICKP